MNNYLIALVLLLIAALGVACTPVQDDGMAPYSADMPARPHIIYLTPDDAVHGLLTVERARSLGFALYPRWADVRQAARTRPLDVLLVERNQFVELSAADLLWLRRRLEEGVVIVGIGIDIEAFSAALGLPNLRASGEAPIPIGDDGYYLFQALLLGAPEDIQAMRDANWLERSILGTPVQLDTQKPLSVSVGAARGKLVSGHDIVLLSQQLTDWIDYAYQERKEAALIYEK